jgi:hypothetical protein
MATKIAQTATEAYRDRMTDIHILMDLLKTELRLHERKAKADFRNWGFAGDAGHIKELLTDAVAFIGNKDAEDVNRLVDERRG